MAKRSPKREPAISLRQILPRADFLFAEDLTFADCCSSIRDCQRGSVYFVLDQDDTDPVQTAAFALQCGAAAIVSEQLLPLTGCPQVIVPDTRVAYGQCLQALVATASRSLTKIGVTGSLGKTCATWLTASVLGQAHPTAFMSSLGRSLSTDFSPTGDPLDFTREYGYWLREAARAGAKQTVVEIHAQELQQHALAGCEFQSLVFTNLTRTHCDANAWLHQRQAMSGLCQHLATGGSVVLNQDDAGARELLRELNLPVLTVGFSEGAALTAKLLERHAHEQTFLLSAGPESIAVRTQYVGDWFLHHALSAGAVGLLHGLSLAQIARGLESVDKLPGRLERVDCGQDFTVFIDAASQASGISATLEIARELSHGRVLAVCGVPGQQAPADLEQLGQTLEAQTDHVVLTHDAGELPDTEHAAAHMLAAMDSTENITQQWDRRVAIEQLLARAQPGDVVIITGGKNRAFPGFSISDDDRDIAERWLRAKFTR